MGGGALFPKKYEKEKAMAMYIVVKIANSEKSLNSQKTKKTSAWKIHF